MVNAGFGPKSFENEENPKNEDHSGDNEFDMPVEEEGERNINDEEEYSSLTEDNDYDNYGRSGEKYGWYNGWSDDVIDDAFEGDPENTWNVD